LKKARGPGKKTVVAGNGMPREKVWEEMASGEEFAVGAEEPAAAMTSEAEAQASELNQAMEGEKVMEAADFGNVWTQGAKRAVELYVESSERMAKMMLELHERSTSWAKETMLAPLFEAQRTAGKQMVDSSMEMARKLCGIDKRNGA
jgi:phage terminase Nu1 subunit (DNA packaging protein)